MINSQQETPESLPGATNLLIQALSFYKERFWTFMGVMLIPQFIVIIYLIALRNSEVSYFVSNTGLVSIIFLFLISISVAWAQFALYQSIKDNQKIGVLAALHISLSKLHYYYLIYIFAILAIIIGSALFVLPGVYLVALLSTGMIVLTIDDQGWRSAISKSLEYIKGTWLGVFWRFFFIISLFFLLFLYMPPTMRLLGFSPENSVANFVSMMLFIVLLTPLSTSYSFLIYRNLKNSKEGGTVQSGNQKNGAFFKDLLLLILVFAVLIGYHTMAKRLSPSPVPSQQSPELTQENALKLMTDILPFRGCVLDGVAGEYKTCTVDLSRDPSGLNVYTVRVVYEGLFDNKTEAIKITALTNYFKGKWTPQSFFKSQKCLPDRGYQDFSAADCI